jgi:flavodoxin
VPTATVVYRSATGTTRRLAEEIGAHLESRGITTTVQSVGDADAASLAGVDLVLLGCWTSGLFVVAQHPDEPWMAFVRGVPPLGPTRFGLFTTYKLATGSMFRRMRAALAGKADRVDLELKSRDGHLSDAGRLALDRFVAPV